MLKGLSAPVDVVAVEWRWGSSVDRRRACSRWAQHQSCWCT